MPANSILNKPFMTIDFEDVEAYCSLNRPVSATLQYIPSFRYPHLSQHLAAMANTYGGLAIIGVSLDAKTGLPANCTGIKDVDGLQETAHDIMRDINPVPYYEIRKTNPVSGRVFLLVRVHEGQYGPYHISIDPHTVWLRSGKADSPLELATRKQIHNIAVKKSNLQKLVKERVDRCEAMFNALSAEAEDRRENNYSPSDQLSVYTPSFSDNQVLLKMGAQPLANDDKLLNVNPHSLAAWLPVLKGNYLTDIHQAHFPESKRVDQIPNGTASFQYFDSGDIYNVCSDQFYSDGTVFHAHNVLQRTEFEPLVYMTTVCLELYDFLEVLSKLYIPFEYNGQLSFNVELSGCKRYGFLPVLPDNYKNFQSDIRTMMLNDYSWSIDLSTNQLSNKNDLLNVYHILLEKVFWDMRFTDYDTAMVKDFLAAVGRIESTESNSQVFLTNV